jgi:hypothetical protein
MPFRPHISSSFREALWGIYRSAQAVVKFTPARIEDL